MITAFFLILVYNLFYFLTALLPSAATYPLDSQVATAFATLIAIFLLANRYVPATEILTLFTLTVLFEFWLFTWHWISGILNYIRGR